MNTYLEGVGNTPLVQINLEGLKNINLYAKLEFSNPTGSVKDRAAAYIIQKLLKTEEIKSDTTILESSSGNFGIALSAYCKKNNLKFYCIIDPNITKTNEVLLNSLCSKIIKVTEPDGTGGYLLNRIKKVKELLLAISNSYWINQYHSLYNAEAYYNTLGIEICKQVDKIDYIFIAVSSGGTITGVSQRIKENFPKTKIIAVDIDGSVIFGGKPKKRHIPGIGSSMVPSILKYAKIDEVVIVDELNTVAMCNELLREHAMFCGGSSGSVTVAVKQYFEFKRFDERPNVVAIYPDKGDRYIDSVYNNEWVKKVLECHKDVI
jgi:2,3-diaminopropionate biosynthesis protein SbnA